MTKVNRSLEAYPFVRLRAHIYFGGLTPVIQQHVIFDGSKLVVRELEWVPALFTYWREILDNALDEVIGHKNGKAINVQYDPVTFNMIVEDDGKGIPIKHDPNIDGIPASVLLSKVQTGSNFDEDELIRLGFKIKEASRGTGRKGAWGGVNGLGGSVVNFTSERFTVDVWRDNKHFHQSWGEGVEEIETVGYRIIGYDGPKRGTRIEFKPSKKVFQHMILPEDLIRSHLWIIACENAGRLRVTYNGDVLKPDGKTGALARTILKGYEPIELEIEDGSFKSQFYLVPGFSDREMLYSMVNRIPAFNGGTHLDAFRDRFYPAMMELLRKQAEKRKIELNRGDLTHGVLLFNTTEMEAPDFDSQSKTKLTNQNVVGIIKKGISDETVSAIVKKNKSWIEAILERCDHRHDKKAAGSAAKKSKQKSPLLIDANGHDRSQCILFIAEGDSAIEGMKEVRDAKIHGGLPLRGKIQNANNMKRRDVLESPVYSSIINAMGLSITDPAQRSDLRYGAIYIAADEDEDGKHITTLIVNFFYRYWPELFARDKKPFIYKFETPLIIMRKGSQAKYVYAREYADFQAHPGKYKGWDIVRAKGLGALEKSDWKNAIQNPSLIPIVDDGNMETTLELLFGESAEARKAWLEQEDV